MSRAVVLFTRDLRTHDHPALAAAAREHDEVVPLFVLDPRLARSANRVAFLRDALADLRARLDGALAIRRGDPAAAVASLRPDCVYLTSDVGGVAARRLRRLQSVARVRALPGGSIVEPGELSPAGGGCYRVFTPYWRAWRDAPWRELEPPPAGLELPRDVEPGTLPPLSELVDRSPSPGLPRGGESEGRRRLEAFLARGLRTYAETRDLPAVEGTSRLSPYLRFGCVSPLEVALRAISLGDEAFARQLAWRDFYRQLLAAYPSLATVDYRPRRSSWREDPVALEAWKAGRTGIPIVDAGMRQLRAEGWVHNRVRMLVSSFLVKSLGIDWRSGAAHFSALLVDGDPASNAGNWQWVAGTGTDTRPNRVLNPLRQAHRFDADGAYVRRFVPELADLGAPEVHEPWRLGPLELEARGYPPPLVEIRIGR
ncbi:MAG: DNA photolyase family protein [Gaiellaceae bacterium]|nr:DNA photolyase family protein [Gaiellaceae bacterium]